MCNAFAAHCAMMVESGSVSEILQITFFIAEEYY
jgi:hypothetical protein